VAEDNELRAQKRCEFKPLLTAPQSHAYKTSNPRAMHGHPPSIKPRCNPKKKKLMKKGVVVETLTHSINRRRGGSGHGDRAASPRYLWTIFSYMDMMI
jgi:hypothetical protein